MRTSGSLHPAQFALRACLAAALQIGLAPPAVAQSLSVQSADVLAPAAELAVLADRYVDRTFELNPVMATWNGDPRYAANFVDNLTPAWRASERSLQTQVLEALKKFDVQQLSDADRLTHAVLE